MEVDFLLPRGELLVGAVDPGHREAARPSRLPAPGPRRREPDAVPADRQLGRTGHAKRHLYPEAATPSSRSAGVGHQRAALDDERQLVLQRLDLGDYRPAAQEIRAGGVGAVRPASPADPAEFVAQGEPTLAIVAQAGQRVDLDESAGATAWSGRASARAARIASSAASP